jgi:Ca2+-binding EF-hand superfamily protein|tara:strand:+ start:356 stop:493 length:138 start_codon:yes stop_codon:yes gene_type:complete
MSKFGMDINDEEIKQIMAVHDADGDGGIDKEEFAKLFGIEESTQT